MLDNLIPKTFKIDGTMTHYLYGDKNLGISVDATIRDDNPIDKSGFEHHGLDLKRFKERVLSRTSKRKDSQFLYLIIE